MSLYKYNLQPRELMINKTMTFRTLLSVFIFSLTTIFVAAQTNPAQASAPTIECCEVLESTEISIIDTQDKIAALISGQVSDRLTDRFEETISNTKKTVDKTIKKNIYPLHKGKIPFSNCKMTHGRRVIRNLFNMQDFGELTYR